MGLALEESKSGELIQFPVEKEPEVIIKMPKMKKDGSGYKNVKSNSKRNRDNVQPYKEEDVPKMVKYFRDLMKEATNDEDYQIRFRNLTLFVMGINISLRVSDLVSLKWSDVYDKRWCVLDGKKVMPKKTSKEDENGKRYGKHVILKFNDSFKRAISEYKDYMKPTDLDSYIFSSRQNPDGCITTATVSTILTTAADTIGINYPTNTHSMRKFFARSRYDHSTNKDETLVQLMYLYGHSSTRVTMHYICITEEEIEDLYNAVNAGYDDI
jgi:integrase